MTGTDAGPTAITTAVVLMAGAGSRLRVKGANVPKPLTPVAGRPLFAHLVDRLIAVGITELIAVVGCDHEAVSAGIRAHVPRGLNCTVVYNADWQQENGLSLAAAATEVRSGFLLAMGDHIFDDTLLRRLIDGANADELSLAVDRKISGIFDLDDAMKVVTNGNRIVEISKDLAQYDAIDTGFFICPREVFDYVDRVRARERCSVAAVVRAMAADMKASVVDIGDAWWQDVDTPEMLAAAEEKLAIPA